MFSNPFSMVVAIVFIVAVTGVLRARYGAVHGDREDNLGQREADPETQRMREELRALKEWVAVLERIATENDRGLSLDREIEALRSRD